VYKRQANPAGIAGYEAKGGYRALVTALSMRSDDVLDLINRSGLRGRGGAGFPTGTKAQAASASCVRCMRYVVCNADEGEPGTFKDRVLMEQDPHSLIEGMLIAAYAVGAAYGYIYIRGEYFNAIEKTNAAILAARDAGYLGKNIKGTAFSFDLEVMRGAGSYLCGEELTLIESLEGKRGYPRIKPPFPAEKGLWGQPTIVINVENLYNLVVMVKEGPD
jgi:NADH:ubiquinone oxidoreductase subunit F (NADH-binding)